MTTTNVIPFRPRTPKESNVNQVSEADWSLILELEEQFNTLVEDMGLPSPCEFTHPLFLLLDEPSNTNDAASDDLGWLRKQHTNTDHAD